MKLTYDTLLHVICMTTSIKDAIQLTATCRILYHEGAKFALKKPIRILNGDQLASFLQFLLAEDLSRCRYLRQLELWDSYAEAEDVQVLVKTLPLLTNIENLRLASAEELLKGFPALVPPFAALTSLQYLHISAAKEVTCGLLSALRSPLVSLQVDFLSDDDVKMWDVLDEDQWSQYHPTKLLANFAATLEELHCMAWYTNQEDAWPTTVYPKMRKLAIELHDFPLRIDPFIRAFPNLTDLYVATEYHGEVYSVDIDVSHNRNVAHQLGAVNASGAWPHLECFHGRLFDLYALGLTCHISRVDILSPLEGQRHTVMLERMLHYVKPLHLKLEGITGAMLGDADRGFISMLLHASAADLVNLDVCISFREDDREKDLTGTMEDLFSALGRLPLKFLKLRFHTHHLDPTPPTPSKIKRQMCAQRGLPEPPDPIPAPLTRAELSLKALDMDALVTRMAESLTGLEAARVTMPRFPRRGGDMFEKRIVKGTSPVPGREQWRSWTPGKNDFVWSGA
ncbi:hypothetical protein GSI_07307 [Ganoderma sinense ZZ0214-1]|uniref:F-box domain-containing protein n=1 Tax=Ganoderma sinense ZZ0214-1 TaxID=1077348 RepID=A0A2G8SA09_9APHY|nr:hypothetical protein GSI_07307 [Ganoderma sinense ZZ0214-1]